MVLGRVDEALELARKAMQLAIEGEETAILGWSNLILAEALVQKEAAAGGIGAAEATAALARAAEIAAARGLGPLQARTAALSGKLEPEPK
jgi:hypothetical protein